MIGGISCPTVVAAASTPPAKRPRKPLDFMSGMVITPVEAVLATADPLMVPVKAEDKTATKADPQRILPATTYETSITKSLATEITRKPRKIMNKVMLEEEMLARIPNSPSSL